MLIAFNKAPNLFDRYYETLRNYFNDNTQLAPSSSERYARVLSYFFAYLEKESIKLHEITVSIMNDFFKVRRTTCQLRTVNNQFNGVIFPFLEWLNDNGVLPSENWRLLKKQKRRYPRAKGRLRKEVFQESQVQEMLDHTSDSRTRMVIWILFNYGLRPIELSRLKDEDVLLHKAWLQIRDSKSNRDRSIPIPPNHIEIWVHWHREKKLDFPTTPYVIPNRRHHKRPLSVRQLENIVKEAGSILSDNSYPYKFRTTAGTLAAENLPIGDVRDFLGHSSIASTDSYVQSSDASRRKRWEQFKGSDQKESSKEE